MPIVTLVLYVTACLLCGLIGRHTAFGFLGHFIVAMLITPVGDFLIQLVGRPSREARRRLKDLNLD
ncbi:MAG: hypothetical protein RBT55_10895 [Rhodocyclaceae bacterium]|jgi:hypothetical protein|nr:hypothetical protein [Rhodocyclaceae bacterium]